MTRDISIREHAPALDGGYILLLTSNSEEKKAINSILANARSATIGADTRGCSLGMVADRFVVHITGESGLSKPASIGRIAVHLLSETARLPKPAIVVLAGFCWGNPAMMKTGDIIVTSHVLSLNEQRETGAGTEWVARPLSGQVDVAPEVLAEVNLMLGRKGMRVTSGLLASLETRFESDVPRDELLKKWPELLGGEMEAFSFLPSCTTPWLVVKAVSDYGGTDYDRAHQADAASRAAETTRCLLQALAARDRLTTTDDAAAHELLADVLAGDTIVVLTNAVHPNKLNDYLDGVIGPQVMRKLRNYSSELEYGRAFGRVFCDCLLELTQNALRHGRANRVSIQFLPMRIVFADDGDVFDPRTLAGERGGARAWKSLANRFDLDAMLTVRKAGGKRKNSYSFVLEKVQKLLADARDNCRVRIAPGTINTVQGRPEVFEYDAGCRAVYLDTSRIHMTSRRLAIAEGLRRITESGRKVFLGCRDSDDVMLYKELLRDIPAEQLTIFVQAPSA
jgi:nucleoside phosphorylase